MTINNEPQFWRMQLHPECDTYEEKKKCTDLCLEQRRIGLAFAKEGVGDLRSTEKSTLGSQDGYYDFYDRMEIGDIVLISLSNKPYALVRVIGEYKYSADLHLINVWCPHHRRVDLLAHFDKHEKQLPLAKNMPTTGALQRIKQSGDFYDLVKAWLELLK